MIPFSSWKQYPILFANLPNITLNWELCSIEDAFVRFTQIEDKQKDQNSRFNDIFDNIFGTTETSIPERSFVAKIIFQTWLI